jgi:hypothetical protein
VNERVEETEDTLLIATNENNGLNILDTERLFRKIIMLGYKDENHR